MPSTSATTSSPGGSPGNRAWHGRCWGRSARRPSAPRSGPGSPLSPGPGCAVRGHDGGDMPGPRVSRHRIRGVAQRVALRDGLARYGGAGGANGRGRRADRPPARRRAGRPRGRSFRTKAAYLHTRGERRPPIYISAFGPDAAAVAARHGDGLWTLADPEAAPGLIQAYRSACDDAGREAGEIILQAGFAWAPGDDSALEGARVWKPTQLDENFTDDRHDPRTMYEKAERELSDEESSSRTSSAPTRRTTLSAFARSRSSERRSCAFRTAQAPIRSARYARTGSTS